MANIKYARQKAQKLLKDSGIKTKPVSLEKICNYLNITKREVNTFDDDETSGCLVREGNTTVIGVNANHHVNRKRFTISHEIGHFLLHKGKVVHVDKNYRINFRNKASKTATDPEEIEANAFAAELLIPDHLLIRDLKKYNLDLENDQAIKDLAKDYCVSPLAMTLRLVNLGYLPTDIIHTL